METDYGADEFEVEERRRAFGQECCEFLEYMARALVDRPEEVKVRVSHGERTSVFFLQVGKGEVGKVIGKEGRTATALRTMLVGYATKNQVRAVLEIED